MSAFDVDTHDMDAQFPSDSDADALFAGRPVEGVPSQLGEMLATMRERATNAPGVPASQALTEFIIERTPAVTTIGATSATGSRSARPLAKKAAAALAIVPAKLLIGATMAAAAVGGAQALGVVDVPLLPGPEPVVVTSVPVETVAPTTAAATTTVATTTVAPSSDTPAETPVSTAPTVPDTTVQSVLPAEVTPVTSPTAEPAPAAGDPGSGCDFGQGTSGRADGVSNDDGPDRGSGAAPNSVAPPVDPCERGDTERTPPSGPAETVPSGPAETGRGNGAPESVPADNAADPPGAGAVSSPDDNPGNGEASARSNGAAAERGPASGQGGNDGTGGENGSTSPSPNSERGRTPHGD